MAKQMIVKHNRASLMRYDGVNLLPGANAVDVEWAKRAVKHPIVKKYIDEGHLEFEFPEDQKSPDLTDYLSGVKQPEAIATVKKTIDANLLKSWAGKETRPHVKAAITKQLKALAEDPKFRDESSEGETAESVGDASAADENLKPDFSGDAGSDE